MWHIKLFIISEMWIRKQSLTSFNLNKFGWLYLLTEIPHLEMLRQTKVKLCKNRNAKRNLRIQLCDKKHRNYIQCVYNKQTYLDGVPPSR